MLIITQYVQLYQYSEISQMFNRSQKEKFITMMVENVGYFNKELTIRHIIQFLHANESFTPRQAVRSNAQNNGQIFSFIQLNGFIEIKNDIFQMLIGIPKIYPTGPPMFLIMVDKQYHRINDEENLLKNNLIAWEKNERSEDFIRLRFPMIQKQWKPKDMSLAQVHGMVMRNINNPPIITSKPSSNNGQINNSQKIMKSEKSIQGIKSKQATEIIGALYNDYADLLISKQNLSMNSLKIDYFLCRQKYLENQHLSKIQHSLDKYISKINNEVSRITSDISQVEKTNSVDAIIQIKSEQEKTLELMSKGQALKDAEVVIRNKIQATQSVKFGDYKKLMKVVFDRMFDNQTQTLRNL